MTEEAKMGAKFKGYSRNEYVLHTLYNRRDKETEAERMKIMLITTKLPIICENEF